MESTIDKHEEAVRVAYDLYLRRRMAGGLALDDWIEAEGLMKAGRSRMEKRVRDLKKVRGAQVPSSK